MAGFGDAAELAAEAGLDGIEISGAHRYLVGQFFDPELNRRDDEWAERSASWLAVVRAVRAAAPGLCARRAPVRRLRAVRGRWPRSLRRAGSTTWSIALGESPSYSARSLIVPPPLAEATSWRRPAAVRVGPPLIATSRIVDVKTKPSGCSPAAADALGMTRALIADPDCRPRPASRPLRRSPAASAARRASPTTTRTTRSAASITPRTGRELHLASTRRTRAPGRSSSSAAGPPAWRPPRAARAGTRSS